MFIAITGTIGSGKSTISAILREMGQNVLSCDEINAELIAEKWYLDILEQNFSGVVKDGALDKKALSKIIFNDENARKKLNSIAHPLIIERIKQKAQKMSGDVFVEVPLLAESGKEADFDKIWLTVTDKNKQISRVAKRDGISEEEAKKIYDIQSAYNDFTMPVTVIDNNYDKTNLRKKLEELICVTE